MDFSYREQTPARGGNTPWPEGPQGGGPTGLTVASTHRLKGASFLGTATLSRVTYWGRPFS